MHVTLRLEREVPSIRTKSCLKVLRAAFRDSGRERFRLVHFSVQRDHIHMIVEAADKAELSNGVRALEIRVARRLNAMLGRRGRFFAERYHAHVLATPTEARRALNYVLLNGRKHELARGKRYAADLVDFYSSAILFTGWSGPVRLSSPHGDGVIPIAPPGTWLLREGWSLQGGRLSPNAVPGPRPRARA